MSENNNFEKSYCLRCKSQQDIKDVEIKLSKNNKRMMSGLCILCNTKTNKFLKNEISKLDELVELKKKEDDKKENNNVQDNNVHEKINHIEHTIKKNIRVKKNQVIPFV